MSATIKLRIKDGKFEVLIAQEGDPEDLPHEHERKHRDFVHGVLGENLDGVEVTRGKTPSAEGPVSGPVAAQRVGVKASQK